MIIPVRCFTCGNVVADKWKPFVEGIIQKKEMSNQNVSSNLDIQYIYQEVFINLELFINNPKKSVLISLKMVSL